MALDEGSKKRIEEEELYRAKLREEETYRQQIREKNFKKKKSIGCLPKVLIILVVWAILSGIYNTLKNPSDIPRNTSPSVSKKDLDGSVSMDGMQVRITNNEQDVWTKCWFAINDDYHFPSNAPSTVTEDIKAGETFYINITDFTKKNGERFNPYLYKNNNISASCNGRFGYWTW